MGVVSSLSILNVLIDLLQFRHLGRADEMADSLAAERVEIRVVKHHHPVPSRLRPSLQLGLLVVDGELLQIVFDNLSPPVRPRGLVDRCGRCVLFGIVDRGLPKFGRVIPTSGTVSTSSSLRKRTRSLQNYELIQHHFVISQRLHTERALTRHHKGQPPNRPQKDISTSRSHIQVQPFPQAAGMGSRATPNRYGTTN